MLDPNPSAHDASILLVEDEPLIAATLCDDLKEQGYVVAHTDNGTTALAMIASGDFRTVITDVRLPGADGLQVVHAARQRHPGARILVITAGGTEYHMALLRGGAGQVIQKPFLNHCVIDWLRAGAQ